MATLTDLTDTVWTFNGGITDIDWTALSRITSSPQLSFTANNDNFISFGYTSSQGLRYNRDYTVSNYVQVTDDNWNSYKTIHITGPVGTSSTQMVWNTSFIAWMNANATMHKRYFVAGDALDATADAIRTKGGTADTIEWKSNGFADAIAAIHTEPNLQSKTASYTPTESAQTETISAESGYDGLDSVAVSVGAIPSNYVGSGVTRRTSSDLSSSGAAVTAPAGYYENPASKSVASGSATTPATSITANPTITVGSDGSITSSVSATQSVTPTVSEGYVSSGTAGNVTISGSNSKQLPTAAGTTITPSSVEQTAVAEGVYTTGEIKVAAVPDAAYTLGVDARPSYVGQDTYWRIKPSINVTAAGNVPTGEVIGTGGVTYPYLEATTVTPNNTTQTIGASGTYMGGAITVLPAPANVTITQDSGTGEVTIV